MDAYKMDLRRAYDRDAERRDQRVPDPWRLEIVDRLAALVGGGSDTTRVVELGCGTGQLARRLADAGCDVTAVDLSQANAERTAAKGVSAVVADFARLPFAAGAFEAALAFNSLLHVPLADLPDQFAEIRRTLERGAVLVTVMWGGRRFSGPMPLEWLDPPRYFSLLDDRDVATMQTPGFDRIETRLLHEHATNDMHPQVLVLVAR